MEVCRISQLGVSTNLGDRVEILGNNDALYATILDIINKNRNYPKMARIQQLQDRIQVGLFCSQVAR